MQPLKPPTEFRYPDENGHRYQIRRMNAVTQVIVAQKIAPLVIPVMALAIHRGGMDKAKELAEKMKNGEEVSKEESETQIFGASVNDLQQVAFVMQQMPEEDTKYICKECLSCLFRQGGEALGWQPVWNPQTERPIFHDIEGWDVIMLTFQVAKDQLGNFTSGALGLALLALQASPTNQ